MSPLLGRKFVRLGWKIFQVSIFAKRVLEKTTIGLEKNTDSAGWRNDAVTQHYLAMHLCLLYVVLWSGV